MDIDARISDNEYKLSEINNIRKDITKDRLNTGPWTTTQPTKPTKLEKLDELSFKVNKRDKELRKEKQQLKKEKQELIKKQKELTKEQQQELKKVNDESIRNEIQRQISLFPQVPNSGGKKKKKDLEITPNIINPNRHSSHPDL